jgi:hypothetical protein
MDQREFDRRMVAAAHDHAALVLANLAQASAELEAMDAASRAEGSGSPPTPIRPEEIKP